MGSGKFRREGGGKTRGRGWEEKREVVVGLQAVVGSSEPREGTCCCHITLWRQRRCEGLASGNKGVRFPCGYLVTTSPQSQTPPW